MREDFLHYLWKFKKFQTTDLRTDEGQQIEILKLGQHNHLSGPDFFNARLKIADQLWAGNVEIHIKSSDWFLHQHETDPAYDNVILHVVWEHDVPVFRKSNTSIPTLILKDYANKDLLNNYYVLFQGRSKWINCDRGFQSTDDFILKNWLERLFIERLEQKAETIRTLLQKSQNEWEAVLFKMLTRSFGSKINADAFLSLADSIPYSVVRKTRSNLIQLEALFFGQAGLLNEASQTSYHQNLKTEYAFLQKKFKLINQQVLPMQFFRLRPPNFPTIRLSQLAHLVHRQPHLFSDILGAGTKDRFYEVLHAETTKFWKSHYTFHAESKSSKKILTKGFIDLLLINTILPLKFCYSRCQGESNEEQLLEFAKSLAPESNHIISGFKNLNFKADSAFESQALIQLKTSYCDQHRCLQCAVGNALLSQ